MDGRHDAPGALHSPWLIRFNRRDGAARRVFCFPYAGGSAMAFQAWSRIVPEDVDVVGLQYPGRCSRSAEPGLTAFEPLVAGCRDAVAPLLDAGRIAFFGHSLGALVAFEVAHALRDAGARQPDHLFLSARGAPDGGATGGVPDSPPDSLRDLLTDAWLCAFMRRLGGLPEALLADEGVMALILPGLRADLQALGTWRHRPRKALAVPMTVLAGRDDPAFPPDSLSAWVLQTTGRFARHVFPGGHFFLNQQGRAVVDLVLRSV